MGKIIPLGKHFILQGDCTSEEDCRQLIECMGGKKAELLFTSPPYSDQREYGGGLDLSPKHLSMFIKHFANDVNYQVVNLGIKRKDLDIIPYWDDYISTGREAGLKLMAWNVWEKPGCSLGASTATLFPIIHEFCFVFGTKVKETNKIMLKKTPQKYKEGEVVEKKGAQRNKDGSIGYYTYLDNNCPYKKMESVVFAPYSITKDERRHPASFSVDFAEKWILAMTNPGDIVIDPFGGSGTTLIACEKNNRKCLTIEINPEYVEMIQSRYDEWFISKTIKPKK